MAIVIELPALEGRRAKLVIETFPGPASYTAGGFAVTFEDLREVKHVVVASTGGYVAQVTGITGNTATIQVFESANGSVTTAGPLVEVAAGANLSGVQITVIALGE